MEKRYRLVKKEPVASTMLVEGPDASASVVELSPGPNKRYLIHVDVGDLPPAQAQDYIAQVREKVREVMDVGTTLLVPMRNGKQSLVIYELIEESP